MERLTIEKCGELLIKYNDEEYRSPCFGCESISKCNPSKKTCGFYKALERLKEYEDIGLTPGQLIEIDKLYADKCKELAELQKNNLAMQTGVANGSGKEREENGKGAANIV